MLPEIVKELHSLLTAGAKKLGTLSKNEHEDLLWAVSSRSTNANTVNCLLGKSAGFDKICQSIFDKLEALKARAFSPLEISELQKEIEQAANVVSKALVDSTDHKSKK